MIGMSRFILLKNYIRSMWKWLMQLLHIHFKNQNRPTKGTGGTRCLPPVSRWVAGQTGCPGGVGAYGGFCFTLRCAVENMQLTPTVAGISESHRCYINNSAEIPWHRARAAWPLCKGDQVTQSVAALASRLR